MDGTRIRPKRKTRRTNMVWRVFIFDDQFEAAISC
jgi:hypothetical protein